MASIQAHPKRTVYVHNLPDKIKDEDLRRSLYGVFSQFGGILEVVTRKTIKTRGQAWIVFQDVASAANAIRQMDSFLFYDKLLRVSFAVSDSDAVAKMLGEYKPCMRRSQTTSTPQEHPKPHYKTSFTTQPHASVGNTDTTEPHNILLLINLPVDTDEKRLQVIFGQFPGLKEVRLIQNRHDVAFVEYVEIHQATQAMNSLQGYLIDPDHPMKIVYAKK
jgi:U2 small nuclear ribonucleoprotein B''